MRVIGQKALNVQRFMGNCRYSMSFCTFITCSKLVIVCRSGFLALMFDLRVRVLCAGIRFDPTSYPFIHGPPGPFALL